MGDPYVPTTVYPVVQKLIQVDKSQRTIPADNFCGTLEVNTDNEKMTDEEFRKFVRRTLPFVQFESRVRTAHDYYQRAGSTGETQRHP